MLNVVAVHAEALRSLSQQIMNIKSSLLILRIGVIMNFFLSLLKECNWKLGKSPQ